MNRRLVGLVGAATVLAALGSAHAATVPTQDPSAIVRPQSTAELLGPVAKSVAVSQAADQSANAAAAATETGEREVAQYYRHRRHWYRHRHHYWYHHHYYR